MSEWTEKAREMVRRNRDEIGDGCAYSVYADRLLDACELIEAAGERERELRATLKRLADFADAHTRDESPEPLPDAMTTVRNLALLALARDAGGTP